MLKQNLRTSGYITRWSYFKNAGVEVELYVFSSDHAVADLELCFGAVVNRLGRNQQKG